MAYTPYEDAKKLREMISIYDDAGMTPSAIAEKLGVTRQLVSYHLRKLGRSRPRAPTLSGVRRCVICRTNPVNEMFTDVCSGSDCISVLLSTAACVSNLMSDVNGRPMRVRSDEKILLDILHRADVRFPEEAVVCTHHDVTKVFSCAADHIRYHAYLEYTYPDGHRPRPPSPMWKDEEEEKRYKEFLKDKEFSRRSAWSETPQQRNPRSWKTYRE